MQAEEDEEMKLMGQEEEQQLLEELEEMQDDILESIIPKDPNDDRDVTMEIKHAAGGSESSLFAEDLFKMYQQYCKNKGWRFDVKRLMPDQSINRGCKHAQIKIRG